MGGVVEVEVEEAAEVALISLKSDDTAEASAEDAGFCDDKCVRYNERIVFPHDASINGVNDSRRRSRASAEVSVDERVDDCDVEERNASTTGCAK